MRKFRYEMIWVLIFLPFLGVLPINHAGAQTKAKIFAEGLISTTAGNEYGLCFTPDGKEIYFTRSGSIYKSKMVNGSWSAPKQAGFAKQYKNFDPFIAWDGSRMFYMSSRPTNDENVKTEVDLWAVDKLGNGWGIPRNLGDVVNTLGIRDGSPGAAANGNLYFFSERQGGMGASDIPARTTVLRFVRSRYREKGGAL